MTTRIDARIGNVDTHNTMLKFRNSLAFDTARKNGLPASIEKLTQAIIEEVFGDLDLKKLGTVTEIMTWKAEKVNLVERLLKQENII